MFYIQVHPVHFVANGIEVAIFVFANMVPDKSIKQIGGFEWDDDSLARFLDVKSNKEPVSFDLV